MWIFVLEYQPFVPGVAFFILLGLGILTLALALFVLAELIFGKFNHNSDRLLWLLLMIVTLGLASFFYLFQRNKMMRSKPKTAEKK